MFYYTIIGNGYEAIRFVTITHRGSKTTQGVVIYVVKTIETTGGWKLLPWSKLRLQTCGLSHLTSDAITNKTVIKCSFTEQIRTLFFGYKQAKNRLR